MAIGEVASLLEVVGKYVVVYYLYGSGLVEHNGHMCVLTSSKSGTLGAVLMNPAHVQCAHLVPFGEHSYVVTY